jgi:hypothetical protein
MNLDAAPHDGDEERHGLQNGIQDGQEGQGRSLDNHRPTNRLGDGLLDSLELHGLQANHHVEEQRGLHVGVRSTTSVSSDRYRSGPGLSSSCVTTHRAIPRAGLCKSE